MTDAAPPKPPRRSRTKAPAPQIDPGAVGISGLRISGGMVLEESLSQLRGPRGQQAYADMADNDPTCGAIIFVLTSLLRATEWTVQAASEDEQGEAGKAWLESVMADMEVPWSAVITEAATMFQHGFAPLEIVLRKRDRKQGSRHDDGTIGLETLELRSQVTIARWGRDPVTGKLTGFWQITHDRPETFIPIERVLLFRTTEAKGNPEGRSILRSAFRPWTFKRRIEEVEAVGLERDLAGLPIARIPGKYFLATATPQEKNVLATYRSLVTSIRRDTREGIVLPSDAGKDGKPLFDLTLLASGGSRQIDTTKIVDRYDRAIATSVLADFIFLGQQAVGSFALSSDKTALFATALGAFAAAVEAVFNRVLIPLLWALNGFDEASMPELKAGDLEQTNLTELAGFISTMAAAGAQFFPDRELENHIRRLAGLPELPEEDGLGGMGDPTGEDGLEEDPEAAAAGEEETRARAAEALSASGEIDAMEQLRLAREEAVPDDPEDLGSRPRT